MAELLNRIDRTVSQPVSTSSFEAADAVQPTAFGGATVGGDRLEVNLPAKSVVVLALR